MITRPTLHQNRRLWRDVADILLLIAGIYAFVNLMTSRAIVEGSSMEPNFFTHDLVIVNRAVYFFASPQRGDVVVLHNPNNADQDFIKRVIGLPNEHIDIRGGQTYINGQLLDEPYISRLCPSYCDGEWQLGPDEYFVLGDNRPHSHDSHSFGPIKRQMIVGQAWIKYWPLNAFEIIHHPDYIIFDNRAR
jgi:signal peptidase I